MGLSSAFAESGILSCVQLGLPFSEAGARPIPGDGAAPPSASTIAPVYFVRHRRARRYLLRVEFDGRVRVTIPRGGSRREADAFAQRHVEWVARQRAALSRGCFSADDRQRLRQQAQRELPERLLELADANGLSVTRISIRNQRTRWGSCGRDGHVCLNWRLVAMPSWVRDYVMIHELMHLRRMDHSSKFWKLVEAACPTFQTSRSYLRVLSRG